MVAQLARAEMYVDGVVQGVGFRYYVRRLARQLRLVGYVKNLEDGRVNIICESTENRISEFIEAIRNAPPPIKVEDITASYTTPTGEFKTFKIITADPAEEMVEGFATGAAYFEVMFSKQDQMIERQDRMLEKQDMMLQKQDQMLAKQDMMLAKQDELLAEVEGITQDFRLLMEKRISKIERDIEAIKFRIGLST